MGVGAASVLDEKFALRIDAYGEESEPGVREPIWRRRGTVSVWLGELLAATERTTKDIHDWAAVPNTHETTTLAQVRASGLDIVRGRVVVVSAGAPKLHTRYRIAPRDAWIEDARREYLAACTLRAAEDARYRSAFIAAAKDPVYQLDPCCAQRHSMAPRRCTTPDTCWHLGTGMTTWMDDDRSFRATEPVRCVLPAVVRNTLTGVRPLGLASGSPTNSSARSPSAGLARSRSATK